MGEGTLFTAEQLDRLQEQLDAVRKELIESNPELLTDVEELFDADEDMEDALNGSYVRIEEDRMTAWLYLFAPRDADCYTVEDVVAFLGSRGVTKGLHSSNITAMARKRIYNREVKIALGILPGEGRDGYFDYLFAPVTHRAPTIREDGSVDYTSMSMLQNVKKGDKVAVYHPAVQGAPGYCVTGEELKAKPSRELAPMRGRNMTKLPDGVTYLSEIDGKVELYEGRIDIQNVHEIWEDVTYITGKVEFYGDIIVHGNVETGVVIRAGRNIIVSGTVEAVNLFAGGDIVLAKGIAGGKKAKLSARGNVFADFIENSSVVAGGDIQANIIMNSEVASEGKVILTGKRGTLIGGYTHGLLGVDAVNIGNEVEVKTIVHAGYETRVYRKYLSGHKKEQETGQELARVVDEMTRILRNKRRGGAALEEDVERRLSELNQMKDTCFATLESIKSDKEILTKTMEKGQGAAIKVDGHIYRGTVVCIDTAQFPLEHSTCFMKYSNQNGVISGQVLIV